MTEPVDGNPNASYWHPDGSERTLTEYREAVASGSHVTRCKGCGCPLHSSTATGVCSETCAREAANS